MLFIKYIRITFLLGTLLLQGCQNNIFQPADVTPAGLNETPAVRLSFRYEADVPAPVTDPTGAEAEVRNAAVQADFDTNRTQELLERTILSPDKQRVVAVYHRITDFSSEYRLDMYSPDGQLLRKITSDTMAVHFPDTITWSPDSTTLAFVAMIRILQPQISPTTELSTPTPQPTTDPQVNENTEIAEPAAEVTPTQAAPTPAAPTGILTFRTEQIYICGADGADVKPVTVNEGLIYFYYSWSPDSTMLVALSATAREWRYLEVVASSKGEVLVPQGRPRVIEKNGRERRLDDNLTSVRPVWSPDSSKVATAFDNQIRIYDATGTNPTQAAVPLRNQLLISSQAYDRLQQITLQAANGTSDANGNPNPEPTPEQPLSTLPDEKLLVSYNPIVEVAWTSDELLYLQTAYLRRMKNEAESVRSFSRWHRLIFSAQASPAR
ncbi:hypothetical protein BH20ACI2_BH20ACI2_20560 [soil metagenome]